MKEKTYYEVIVEMEGKQYDELETQLSLGEKCLKGIEALESKNTIKQFQSLVELEGKIYEITVTKWKGLENGIDKV